MHSEDRPGGALLSPGASHIWTAQVCGTAYRLRQDNDQGGISPAFSLSVIVPCLLPGRCPVPEEEGGNASPPHGLPALWSNPPDRCERPARPCTGKPPSTFSLSCPGSLGQTGRSPESYSVAPPRFGPPASGALEMSGAAGSHETYFPHPLVSISFLTCVIVETTGSFF